MDLFVLSSLIITTLLLFSTTVCGLWLKFTSQKVEGSSITFHMIIALLTVISVIISLVLLI